MWLYILSPTGVQNVEVDENQIGSKLKEAVAAKMKGIDDAVRGVQLFMARKNDKTWLDGATAQLVKVDERGKPQLDGHSFVKLDMSLFIKNTKNFGADFEPKEGEIHVLVVVAKAARGTKRRRLEEAPDIWMKRLTEERVTVLPRDVETSKRHLLCPLEAKIPISPEHVEKIVTGDEKGLCTETVEKLFIEREHGISWATTRIVGNAIEPMTPGTAVTSENSFIGFWDSLISAVLRAVLGGTFGRNSSDMSETSSNGLYRPDVCFYKNGSCIFRGEEKASGSMATPFKELYEKLTWKCDDAPYVFGYAAVGYQVCLVIIEKQSTDLKPCGAIAKKIEGFDLGQLNERLSFLLALLNLSTLFLPVLRLIRPLSIPEYEVICRPNGVKLYFAEEGVAKVYPVDMPYKVIINNLRDLHGKMKTNKVPNVVALIGSNLTKKQVRLAPIGLKQRPSDVKQLMAALLCILKALVALHEIGLMHRDLGWENVLKYQGHDEWFLIDFDDGALAPAEGAPHLKPETHSPEIASVHTVEVDIWSVGYLIRTAGIPVCPPQLLEIQAQCLQKDPQERPSAASLLWSLQQLVVT